MLTISTEIKNIRTSNGRSVRQQAQIGGVHHATLLRWESGAVVPNPLVLKEYLQRAKAPLDQADRILRKFAFRERQNILPATEPATLSHAPTRGDLLRAIRRKHSLSQQQFAARLSVTQGTISKWELGVAWPDEEHLTVIAQALAVTPEEFEALRSPSLSWRELGSANLNDCVQSYEQFWRACAVQDRPDGELWGLALTHRLLDLARTDKAALRPLSWVYASRAYWLLVRGRNAEVVRVSKQAIEVGRETGFDLTSGYAFWAIARALMSKSRYTGKDIAVLERLSKTAHALLRDSELPYSCFVDATLRTLQTQFGEADHHLRLARVPRSTPINRDQFSAVGEAYWAATIQSYRQMFALKARNWHFALEDAPSEINEVPLIALLSRSYQLAAAARLKEPAERELQSLRNAAATQGYGFALDTMHSHIKSLSGIRFHPSACFSPSE